MKELGLKLIATYSFKVLKLINYLFVVVIITFVLQLFLFSSTTLAAPSASIGTSTTSSVAQSIDPTEDGKLGTNQAATIQYSTTCKNTNGKATIYISATSPALTGSGNASGSTIPASSNTTAGTLAKDTWGYSLNNSSTNTSSYLGVTTDKVAIATLTPNTTGTQSGSKTIYYNANVSTAKPSGTYSTTVTYTALLDDKCNQYTVSYNGNSPTSGSAPSSVTNTWSSSTNRTLSGAGTLAKNGYVFQGWASSQARANSLTVDFCVSETELCSGSATYKDDVINPNNDTTVTLYAVWKQAYYMQDVDTVAMCQSMEAGKTMVMYDRRDGSYYNVGKLADGKCWMLQNLRIINTTISSADSNFTSKTSYTIPASVAKGTSTGFDASTGYTTSAVYAPASTDGAKIYSGSDTSDSWTTTTDTNNIGVLYNYYTATAGTISGSSNSTAATEDICPKGWHLPSANSDTSDFGYLVLQYGATSSTSRFTSSTDAYKKFNNAFRTVLAGYYLSGLLYNSGSNGYYWFSTASSTTLRYNLNVYLSYVNPADDNARYSGRPVRCVAKPIMQETTTIESCLKLAEGQTMAVVDKRDGNEYTIGKLADGQCWMLQNLRIINTTISSADSNFTSKASYTIPASTATGTSTGFNGSTGYTTSATYAPASDSGAKIYSGGDTSSSWTTTTDTNNIGVLYNYYTATAGTISGSGNSTAATEDICPKGWHLPSANSDTSDFGALVMAYGNGNGTTHFSSSTDAYKKFNNAFKTVLTGGYSGSLNLSGSDGYYWSSTADGTTYRYNLNVDSSNAYPASNSYRYSGQSVRCVAKTMQSTSTIEECKAMTAGQTMIAYDKRDGSDYTIGKLADGECWMLQNLRIINTTISSADSNFTSKASYTIPASKSGSSWSDSLTASYVHQPNRTDDGSNFAPMIYSGSDTKPSLTDTTDANDTGVLYNYCAATAETICTDRTTTEAYEDICPKGWHLPSSNSNTSDIGNLVLRYGATTSMLNFSGTAAYKFNNAFKTVMTGRYYSESLYLSGSYGFHWTSTARDGEGRYNLSVKSTEVSPINFNDRHLGLSVRCVAGH